MQRLILVALTAATLIAAAAGTGTGAPLPPKMPYAFERNCFGCHKDGVRTGPATILDMRSKAGNTLHEEYIKSNVRFGFNAMPAFRPSEVNTKDLDGIVAYLKQLAAYRKSHPGYQPDPEREGGRGK